MSLQDFAAICPYNGWTTAAGGVLAGREQFSENAMDGTTLYVLTVVFVATLIRSVFGFGEALVAVPLARPPASRST